jgi:Mg2+ and Co2+ transporter CorA
VSHDHKNLLFLGPNPKVTLAEWIPFGTNNLILLEEKLEAHDKWGECMLTAFIDDDPETATVELDEPETKVTPVSGKDGQWVAFHAEVNYKSTGGEHQVEQFTTRVGERGVVTCDLELVETNGNSERHSLDDLAKVLADLVEDTSSLMNTLLNNFQRRLLDLVYCDQASQRDKYVLILADELIPERDVETYLDDPAYRAELQQIVGRPFQTDALTLEDGSKLIAGTDGAIFISKNAETYRRVLELYCFAESVQSFLTNTFSRMWMTWDRLSKVKEMIRTEGIGSIMEIQDVISELSGDISMFDTILAYVKRAAAKGDEVLPSMRNESLPEEEDLMNALRLGDEVTKIRNRVNDANLIVEGLEKEIQAVKELAQTLGEKETHRIGQFMNVLTIVSVIVLPLSLITGFYGMNFQAYAPAGEMVHPYNMPELYTPLGYVGVVAVMALIALVQVLYFRRKGLLGSGDR